MSETTQVYQKKLGARARSPVLLGESFAPLAAALDSLLIVALSVSAGILYHWYSYGEIGVVANYVRVGMLAAIFYTMPRCFQNRYDLNELFNDPAGIRRIFLVWNLAIFGVLVVAFVAKLTDAYSRGAVILFYFFGLAGLSLFRVATVSLVRRGFHRGWIASKRVMLIGTGKRIRRFRKQLETIDYGLQIASIELLPDRERGEQKLHHANRFNHMLERTVEAARRLGIDTIVLLLPWSDTSLIKVCRDAFLNVPAVTVLAPEQVLERALESGVSRIGPTTGLKLVRAPLSIFETVAKRCMDIAASLFGLILLSPLFLIVALLIKLDSPGPVFFRQSRHGFNQNPFRIIKFRTMTVAEDGTEFRQAVENDPRVTRLGRFLRRWNIDELPQIINVLKGEMSIVGPRPHALVHNHEFENLIALYARRHNVKPGITGWAQVNGFRGVTDTDEKMRGRVEHDLYYIDNWSVWFDIQIILMTLFSRRAFLNAL